MCGNLPFGATGDKMADYMNFDVRFQRASLDCAGESGRATGEERWYAHLHSLDFVRGCHPDRTIAHVI
jgi:hypothetical protein